MSNIVYSGLVDVFPHPEEISDDCGSLAYTDCIYTNSYDSLVNRLHTQADLSLCTPGAQWIRVKALWDTGAITSCVSERFIKKIGAQPCDTGVGVSSTGQVDISYYFLNIRLAGNIIFQNVRVAAFPLKQHDVDLLIGMDIIQKGIFKTENKVGKTVLTFEIQ